MRQQNATHHEPDRRLNQDVALYAHVLGEKKRFYNKAYECYIVKVFAGEWYVSNRADDMLATVLGSCVSACVRDTSLGIGGMNHFLLPGDEHSAAAASDAARYGVNAMENLINALLRAGAVKQRLEFKVFGGGNVTNSSARIGTKNAHFIKQFLAREGYSIASEDLEGDQPRSLHYYPTSGKVMMRKLKRKEDLIIIEEEAKYSRSIVQKPIEGDIELF